MLKLVVWSLSATLAFSAYCGTSTIPYSFEVLPNGATVLGCARPPAGCFGWDSASGSPASNDANFNQLGNGRPDGFVRNDSPSRQPFVPQNPQTSVCVGSPSCSSGQWVGGFNRAVDGSLSMICCSHGPAAQAPDLGVASISSGQIYMGGETTPGSFDFIQNVVPRSAPDGSIHYDVSAARLSCPEPPPLPVAAQQAFIPAQQVFQQAIPPPQQAIPPPAYNPTPAYGGFYCFAADSTVIMADGSKRRMDELKVGSDYVKAAAGGRVTDVPLTGWLHKLPEEEAEFLVIQTATGKEIKLTDKHFIHKSNCNSTAYVEVTADELSIGDCLIEVEGSFLEPTMIESISRTVQKGIYAPLTDSGIILVDDISVSCFAEANDNILVQTFKKKVVQCDDDSLVCDVSTATASVLLDMMKLAVPVFGK